MGPKDRFVEKMADSEVITDTQLLGDFTAIYCRGNHPNSTRVPVASDGAELGVYGRKLPSVCGECAELLRYSEQRRAFCPRDPKPFCSHCDTHCYRPEMRERMRDVMKYAGPRSIVRGHAIDSVKHLIAGRRAKREAAKRIVPTDE